MNYKRVYGENLPFNSEPKQELFAVHFDGSNYVGRYVYGKNKRDLTAFGKKLRYWFGRLDKTILEQFKKCKAEKLSDSEATELVLTRFENEETLLKLLNRTIASDSNCKDLIKQIDFEISLESGRLENVRQKEYFRLKYEQSIEARISFLKTRRELVVLNRAKGTPQYIKTVIEKYLTEATEEEKKERCRKEAFKTCSHEALKMGLKGQKYRNYLYREIPFLLGEEITDELKDFIFKRCCSDYKNFSKRKRLYHRKARLNRWNYFASFTYDDKKMTEYEFKKKLLKSFSNLAVRHRWRVMGAWEHGEEDGRLHFHALIYVPCGEMIGSCEIKSDYSLKRHKMVERNENSYFAETFGRNDFEVLPTEQCPREEIIEYIGKYMRKQGGKIFYSRHIPAAIFANLKETDLLCRIYEHAEIYVLNDFVIDYERDVEKTRLGKNCSIFDNAV